MSWFEWSVPFLHLCESVCMFSVVVYIYDKSKPGYRHQTWIEVDLSLDIHCDDFGAGRSVIEIIGSRSA